ncbi:Hypp8995 [Branchiostoma lanceolatum]|uniref:Hypp8995 protein n=1 Tax=Branchiostoma lanceolatum TaxID=7740 RepID=A0A8K0EGW4_BRALA|nr:Hypp8995 [Branchiostoma lanceolatum]
MSVTSSEPIRGPDQKSNDIPRSHWLAIGIATRDVSVTSAADRYKVGDPAWERPLSHGNARFGLAASEESFARDNPDSVPVPWVIILRTRSAEIRRKSARTFQDARQVNSKNKTGFLARLLAAQLFGIRHPNNKTITMSPSGVLLMTCLLLIGAATPARSAYLCGSTLFDVLSWVCEERGYTAPDKNPVAPDICLETSSPVRCPKQVVRMTGVTGGTQISGGTRQRPAPPTGPPRLGATLVAPDICLETSSPVRCPKQVVRMTGVTGGTQISGRTRQRPAPPTGPPRLGAKLAPDADADGRYVTLQWPR